MKRTVLALSLLWVLAGTAPASAAFLGENPRLGESFLDKGIGPAAGDVNRDRLPGSCGSCLERPAECFVAPSATPETGEPPASAAGGPGAAGIFSEDFSVNRRYDPGSENNPTLPKHRQVARGRISAEPRSGAAALDNSVRVKGTSTMRVGADRETGQIVVLRRTRNLVENGRVVGGEYHGYVVNWGDLMPEQRNALIEGGLTDKKGNIQ